MLQQCRVAIRPLAGKVEIPIVGHKDLAIPVSIPGDLGRIGGNPRIVIERLDFNHTA